jgi:Domain of unknown function (DUF397)
MRKMRSCQPSQQVPVWRKTSYCASGECVEVATHNGLVVLRDSKRPGGSVLVYTPDEWLTFVRGIKAGEFDDLG